MLTALTASISLSPVHHPVLRSEERRQHPQVLNPPGHPHPQHPQQTDGAEEQGAGPGPPPRGDHGGVSAGDHSDPAGGGPESLCACQELRQLPGALWELPVANQERLLPWVSRVLGGKRLSCQVFCWNCPVSCGKSTVLLLAVEKVQCCCQLQKKYRAPVSCRKSTELLLATEKSTIFLLSAEKAQSSC